MGKIKLLIVHPNKAVRQALNTRLSVSKRIEVVGDAETVSEAQLMYPHLHVDEVLLGIPGRKHANLEPLTSFIQQLSLAGIQVIVLASYMNDATNHELLEAGANRYLLKDINTPQLIDQLVDASNVSFI